ncbi:hypothetical protein ACLMJK_008820 [Lecanora helva]
MDYEDMKVYNLRAPVDVNSTYSSNSSASPSAGVKVTPTAPTDAESIPPSPRLSVSSFVPSQYPTTTSTPSAVAPPPNPTGDGIRLVNALYNNEVKGGGYAWYESAFQGNNGSAVRDAYSILHLNDGGENTYPEWEGYNRTFNFSNFDNTFWVYVHPQTTQIPVNEIAGSAGNRARNYTVYKDDGGLLWTDNGTTSGAAEFFSVYYCQ